MNWTQLLKGEIEETNKVTDALIGMVEDDKLPWIPDTGENWMTTGQLLKHITTACGACMQGFVTGDWGLPQETVEEMSQEDVLPAADKLPAVESVAEARTLLAEDKKIALGMLVESTEEDLANKDTSAPWDSTTMKLGQRLLHMVWHLSNHKGQLYYYLKLQGREVNTWHLYGV